MTDGERGARNGGGGREKSGHCVQKPRDAKRFEMPDIFVPTVKLQASRIGGTDQLTPRKAGLGRDDDSRDKSIGQLEECEGRPSK